MSDCRFFVLLGPDGAGKSSVMTELAERRPEWRLLSTDGEFTPPEHALIAQLRRNVVKDVLPGLGSTYSVDFLASMLQTAVVHLKDRVLAECATGAPVLVDSYYYKILAKCRLAGLRENPMYGWWRTFPQPRGVVFLDVAPWTAWRRSAGGRLLNRLEYAGNGPGWAGFESYQKNLRTLMLEEVGQVPVTVIEEQPSPGRAAEAVAGVLDRTEEFAR
ncbi:MULTISPECIES: ATP-binding protein [Streptomycetaceae]|uniref:Thymidylate kinase n=1 Tax=Streptantibioticus cattleyicolor (strain ATCC 35852 / DSM 46488 / JCM 4925 / NBRC 14057 / NRRL 8057) TaxID=1003195 RepID=F8JS72_STREN|nr:MULTISPECIES: ATP-binding protein [Streptomycetaceae]AEW94183.1 hypothetical protein SCATT_18120 [Streptantibioticus cattleyicolor NRRL 8057 = DSM 46488]MYS58843.1 ATP-binding protein [Streptomyces sp. SID5468]CCB74537.1 conserved protein of unknown function [Streptantibioticus cattleyicolor NRRL 8057 = DSM 46488]